MSDFGIQVDDESPVLPELAIEQNEKTVELHDWQRRAIKYFFDNDCTAIFESTTGAGKSFCAIKIIKEVLKKDKDVYVLIVVPKNIILERTWFKELYDAGISLKDIGVFYGNIKEYSKITITNMQSLDKVALDMFDFVVLDECFSGETKVLCFEDSKIVNKNIKDIVDKKLNLDVLSYNIINKKVEKKKIIDWYKIKEKRDVLDIEFDDGNILTVTPEQLIFDGKKYIIANELKEGDKVLRC